MLQKWQQWERMARKALWALTILGIIAALPLGAARWQMEKTSHQVEYVFDYRDLLQIAAYQAHPRQFIAEQLGPMKQAGITTMAVYETSLQELGWAGKLSIYDTVQASQLEKKPVPKDENYTYVLFAGADEEKALRPIIESTFKQWDIGVDSWSLDGQPGMILETPLQDAILKAMQPDPTALEAVHAAGFNILPRLSDRIPYNQEEVSAELAEYKTLGVTRILFEGNAVKGFADQAKKKTLNAFADALNNNGIGIAVIENSKPQQGMNTLSYLIHYNVARLYSLSDKDAAGMKPEDITDRFLLAAKDRSIRLFYMNGAPSSNPEKGKITTPLQNIYDSLQGKDGQEGAVKKLADFGFPSGTAKPFDYKTASWQKPLKVVVSVGAVALIALLVGAFLPGILLPVFILGLIGSAGLYVLSKSVFEQGLALGAAISAPTLAIIWALGRVRLHTVGALRPVGAGDEQRAGDRWIFNGIGAGRRLGMALAIFIATAVISCAGIPYVVGLLNNITYKLVLEQFRGVSLLHLAPIALSALYVFLYTNTFSPIESARRLLKMQITVLWVAAAAIIGVAGLYYLSRTGNAGQASSLELVFRNMLETTFGVRPRTKEFLLAHPLFIFGLFLALRYRAAWVLFIVGSIGQLSMVDTFAHIHTALPISLIRILLGLGLGLLIGLVLIAVWQIGEGAWRRWATRLPKEKPNVKPSA